MFLLSRAQGNINIAHYLYWWVNSSAETATSWCIYTQTNTWKEMLRELSLIIEIYISWHDELLVTTKHTW